MKGRLGYSTAVLGLSLLLVACGRPAGSMASSPGLSATNQVLADAATEATAIVQRAQATALVLQAQARATALVEASKIQATATPVPSVAVQGPSAPEQDPPAATPTATETSTLTVEVLAVRFAADGGMIMVQFRAPPEEAAKWWPGNVYVQDEAAGTVYNEIPVMPKIGPLIGRPRIQGQLGYVMLTNAAPRLQTGASVKVALGNYTFEHIVVQ
jgi:hypothetical protein